MSGVRKNNSKINNVWEYVGKTLTAIIALGTIGLTIWAFFWVSGEAQLEAKISTTPFEYPPGLAHYLSTISSELSSEEKTLKDLVKYVTIEVTNTGKGDAENVELDIPFHGVATLYADNKLSNLGVIEGKVPIGVIRGGQSVKMQLWVASPVPAYTNKEADIRITHKLGQADMLIGVATFGAIDAFFTHIVNLKFFFFLVVGLAFFTIVSVVYNHYKLINLRNRQKNGGEAVKKAESKIAN